MSKYLRPLLRIQEKRLSHSTTSVPPTVVCSPACTSACVAILHGIHVCLSMGGDIRARSPMAIIPLMADRCAEQRCFSSSTIPSGSPSSLVSGNRVKANSMSPPACVRVHLVNINGVRVASERGCTRPNSTRVHIFGVGLAPVVEKSQEKQEFGSSTGMGICEQVLEMKSSAVAAKGGFRSVFQQRTVTRHLLIPTRLLPGIHRLINPNKQNALTYAQQVESKPQSVGHHRPSCWTPLQY